MKINVKEVEIECPNDLDVVIKDYKVTLTSRPLNFGGGITGFGQQLQGVTTKLHDTGYYYPGSQCDSTGGVPNTNLKY